MISSKLVITYKRKRPSSQFELAQGIEDTKTSPECASSTWTRFGQKAESSAGDSSKKQKRDGERCVPYGKQLCSGCNELHDSAKSVPQRVPEPRKRRENKCTEVSEMGPIILRSRRVLLTTNPGDKTSSKGKDRPTKADAPVEMKPNSVQIDLSSSMNSSSVCKVEQIEGNTGSRGVDMDGAKISISGGVDSSFQRNCSSVCLDATTILKMHPSGNNDSSVESKSTLLSSDVLRKRFSNPLITFSRRAKKKEQLDEADIPKKLVEGMKFSLVKWNNCTLGVSGSPEGSSQRCNSVDQSTASVIFRKDPNMSPLLFQRQDEISGKEVDGGFESAHAGGALETKIAVCHAAQEQNTDLGKASGIMETDDVAKSDEITRPGDTSEDVGPQAHMELSVAPPVGNWVSDHSVQTSVSSPPTSDLLPSDVKASHGITDSLELCCCKPFVDAVSSPQHAIVLHETANEGSRGLEFVEIPDETVQDTPHHQKQKEGNVFSSIDEDDINYKQECDRETCFAPSMNVSVHDPCQQNLSGEILNEVVPLACISGEATTCLGFQGRTFLQQSVFDKNMCKQMPKKSSFCPPHFLGLSLPTKHDTVKDFPSTLSPTSFSIKKSNRIHDHLLGFGLQNAVAPSASEDSPSLARHKQLLENIVTRAEMLKRSQSCSLEKFKGHANTWSEEELDFLWIGVRRHGRGNWETMLRDPKLHFAEWRVAEDLAERWDEEQSKLLNGTRFQPMILSKADSFPTVTSSFLPRPAVRSRYGGFSAAEHRTSRCQTLTTETELSLGDVYIQKEENVRKRYPFHLSGPTLALPLSSSDSPDVGSYLINRLKMGAKQQKTIKGQRSRSYSSRKRGRYDKGFPTSQQKPVDRSAGHVQWSREMFSYGRNIATLNDSPSTHNLPTGLPATGNLPHWLREVFGTPQRPAEPALPPGVSAIAHSVSLLYNDKPVIPPFSVPGVAPVPPKDYRQQQRLRRKSSSASSKVGGLRSPDTPVSAIPAAASCSSVSWMETRLSLLPTPGLSSLKPMSENQVLGQKTAADLNQPCPEPFTPNDLIVIDSEASSEETISDDRSGRQ